MGGPVVEVVQVVLEAVCGNWCAPQEAVDLRPLPVRPALADGRGGSGRRVVLREFWRAFRGTFGAGADERHLTFDDVEKLRQLVEAGGAEPAAPDRCSGDRLAWRRWDQHDARHPASWCGT